MKMPPMPIDPTDELLEPDAEIAPPWARFPEIQNHSIGWRMGYGEAYLERWRPWVKRLSTEAERRAYLERHPPAPYSWAADVGAFLRPDATRTECPTLQELADTGLVESDVAFRTWLERDPRPPMPWRGLTPFGDSPTRTARYATRTFWFWSRAMALDPPSERSEIGPVPAPWEPIVENLLTRDTGPVDPERGLQTLAQMLAAGAVVPPWRLGRSPRAFEDSYEMDMGYVDAYRLWARSAFDDRPFAEQTLGRVPNRWRDWAETEVLADCPGQPPPRPGFWRRLFGS